MPKANLYVGSTPIKSVSVGEFTTPDAVITPLTVTESGTYTASGNVDGYSPVVVNIEAKEDLTAELEAQAALITQLEEAVAEKAGGGNEIVEISLKTNEGEVYYVNLNGNWTQNKSTNAIIQAQSGIIIVIHQIGIRLSTTGDFTSYSIPEIGSDSIVMYKFRSSGEISMTMGGADN